jgi:hypothetical protein
MAFEPDRRRARTERLYHLFICCFIISACAADHRRFPLREPIWLDDDQRLQNKVPEEYFSPMVWEGVRSSIFDPVNNFLSADTSGEATDVNAMDEVPDSSWFENRLGKIAMTPEQTARGPCEGPPPDPSQAWTVIGAKLDGQTPGFQIKASNGRRYLLKFDDDVQPERATAADVIGSKVFYAAGYHVPCNQIVYFEESVLQVPQGDEKKPHRITPDQVHSILQFAPKEKDGRFRAMATEIIPGKIIGPWTYQGTRDDDINDVIPHEHRRELRASYVLSAWLNHFDSRDGNTLATFVETPGGGGFVKHYIIDWGDTLGSLWPVDGLSRRLGYSYYFDFAHVGRDFVTFGLVQRPWEKLQFGPAGVTLGYFNDDSQFKPDEWHDGFPNPAFSRMTERDAAWMTRIVARFTDDHIDAIIKEGQFTDPVVVAEASRMLKSRRDKILQRWLTRLSPLSEPRLAEHDGITDLCLRDLSLLPKVTAKEGRQYSGRVSFESTPGRAISVRSNGQGEACAELLNTPSASEAHPLYTVVEVQASSPAQPHEFPIRVYLYQLGTNRFRIVGLQRPESD